MSRIIKIETFIPAKALEHPANSETARRDEKIRMAILREYLTGDVMGLIEVSDDTPWVYVHKVSINTEKLGYDVLASIELFRIR